MASFLKAEVPAFVRPWRVWTAERRETRPLAAQSQTPFSRILLVLYLLEDDITGLHRLYSQEDDSVRMAMVTAK
jgi:hypothetical protein